MSNTLQERYSALTLKKLRSESIFAGLFSNQYEGQPTAGAVKVPYRAEAATGDYDAANGGSLNPAITEFKTLLIDKDRYVNELIDGYYAAAVPDSMVADRINSAGYVMGHDVDVALAALCKSKGTVLDDTDALTKSTVYEAMVDTVTAAKEAKVRGDEMWFVVSPAVSGLLTKSDDFIKATQGDMANWGRGFAGRIAGVPVFESLNMPADVEFILGNNVYCNYVDEWKVPVGVNDLKDGKHIGASAVQGRLVWGADILEGGTVFVKVVTP